MQCVFKGRNQTPRLRALVGCLYLFAAAMPLRALDALPALCPFRRLTGLPCPGCGGTHAFIAMAHGQFRAAWGWNAPATVVFVLGIPWLLLAVFGRPVTFSRRAAALLGWGVVGVFSVFGAWRILLLSGALSR